MEKKILRELASVNRPGIPALFDFLRTSDFFEAPASTEFHLCCPGGLAQHSMNVYMELKSINEKYSLHLCEDSIVICALLHDICKTNFYAREKRNKKVDGKWEEREVYVVRDSAPLGHGEKSVIILQKFIALTHDEQLAIRWHMGAWDTDGYSQKRTLGQAIDGCKLLKALMLADQSASYFLEA